MTLPKYSLAIFLGMSLFAISAGAEVKINNPIRGWRFSNSNTDVVQEVQYPASSVNTLRNKDLNQLVQGDIQSHAKPMSPMTLIINGLDMPMRTDGKTFARPYIFGRGSNSVEARYGTDKHSVQFYEAKETLTPARLRVLLSWDSDGTDLDLHLVTPSGEHCFYGNRTLASGAALDIDVTDGYGPEIISVPSPQNGTYLVYVNYYGSGQSTGKLTTAKVSIVSHAGTPDEKIDVSVLPMRAPGEVTLIRSFKYP